MKQSPLFATEAELCTAFTEWVRRGGGTRYTPWTVYPETGDFDLLLVDPEGRQMGVEAKLKLNAKVCTQALPGRWYQGEGPDWRAVLVPAANNDLEELLRMLGVIVFTPNSPRHDGRIDFNPMLVADSMYSNWFDWNPLTRCELPPMVPNLPAGVPAPVRLTTWKVGALKVLAHLEVHGAITAREVRSYGVDPRRFCSTDGWLTSLGEGRWARGAVPAFDQQHPAEYAQLLAAAQQAKKSEVAK